MHLFVAVDANEQSHKLFKPFIQTIALKASDGTTTHACVREIRLYNIIVNERNLPELMPILKTHEKVSLTGRGINIAMSLISKIFPFLTPIDTSKYERHGGMQDKIWWREQMPESLPPYIMFIGSIPDIKNEKGDDML
jgi:hypothetical protein